MQKRIFRLVHRQARAGAELAIREAPDGYVVMLSEPTRTLDQNAKLWPMLADVSKQVVWHGQKLTTDEWKDVFTAALRRQKAVPGLDGGFVVCGQSTSKMGKREFAELIELIYAFGAEHGVEWSEPAPEGYEDLARARKTA
ncbi:recombination protein NinB [Cupriavidus gilardii]|uniref:Recombination protein NinB n=1 Tax=Cupriavidus gilardii TaxID=82541 RepID=A0ABY4VSR5_9BURK|nr:recombination protein NinB [Cupriavidus gilardii]USE79004.1 recombination protein NinB [Cupriavidus gilardii]